MIPSTRFFIPIAMLAASASQVFGGSQVTGKVESCSFSTHSLPPPFHVPKQFADGYKLFLASGGSIPEDVAVKSVVLLGSSQLRLTKKETEGLDRSLDDVYGRIAKDPLFANVGSALPYCLADKRPSHGHYFAYYPEKITDETQIIVFLHGFGGNFLFYTYVLKEEFPKAVILVPSWSANWEDGTMQYLDDMFRDAKRRKSFSAAKPCLMAISAGGPAGFRLYNQRPDRFACFVSIASAPSLAIVPTLKTSLKILMVNGKQDTRFPIGQVKAVASKLADRLSGFEIHIVDGDHFFLLSKQAETFQTIKAFLDKQ